MRNKGKEIYPCYPGKLRVDKFRGEEGVYIAVLELKSQNWFNFQLIYIDQKVKLERNRTINLDIQLDIFTFNILYQVGKAYNHFLTRGKGV